MKEISDHTKNLSFGECEICGEPANHMVQDFYKWENHDTGIWDYSVRSKHLFCDEHYRPSEEIDVSVGPLLWSRGFRPGKVPS